MSPTALLDRPRVLGDAGERRRPSVFPTRSAPATALAPRPVVSWVAGPDRLRAAVADHVEAIGGVLIDAGDVGPGTEVGVEVCAVSALRRRLGATSRRGRTLLAVAEGPALPEHAWETCLEAGVHRLVRLPEESDRLLDLLAAALVPRAGAVVIGVTGGCGGAGASSLAARLAGACARRGETTVLVDADPRGGGLDLLVEAGAPRGATWQDVGMLGMQDGAALRTGLPVVDGVHLLAAQEGPMPEPERIAAALLALGATDGTVVVDLGAHEVDAAAAHLDRLVLVVPATDHAVRAARRRLDAWDLPHDLPALVVRRRGALAPRDVAADLDLPLLGSFADYGADVVPLLDRRRRGADRLCRELAAELRTAEEAGAR